MSACGDEGVPELVAVKVEDPHWKVGDVMPGPDGKPLFTIGQIAVVPKGAEADKQKFDVAFFDDEGDERGRMRLIER